jgi:signal transduction histidine kinase
LYSQITEQGAQVDIQTDMPLIFADRQRIFEVAQNLLQNAIKFSNPNSPITVSVSAIKEGDKVICRVEDNGIGIDPQYHEQIFGLFNRLDQSIDGTGIGLSLVKSIIETHKGSVSVESEGAGKGSIFYFSLPVPLDLDTASTTVNQ